MMKNYIERCENMKKMITCFVIVALLMILVVGVLIIPRTDINNATVVISSDYSTITYEGNLYVPIQFEKIPLEVKETWMTDAAANAKIKATVEGENYFLDKYFFTNYIAVEEYEGEVFIYLHTDYDVNESDYYCSKNYKENILE